MATYYITGIKKETIGNHTFVDEVLLHLVEGNSVKKGQLIGKDEVIKLIKGKNSVKTAIWNYTNSNWSEQEEVSWESRDKIDYLRTTRDKSLRDNLLHMLPLTNLGL